MPRTIQPDPELEPKLPLWTPRPQPQPISTSEAQCPPDTLGADFGIALSFATVILVVLGFVFAGSTP